MAVGNGLNASNKSKQVSSEQGPFKQVSLVLPFLPLAAGGVIQKRMEPEIVKAPTEAPPGPANSKGPNHRDKAVPESGQRKDH
jgi:hypothetical protein